MNKITGFVKKNKKLSIGIASAIIILLLIILIKVIVFPNAGGDVYGDRLKDIENHKVSKEVINDIKSELKDQTSVDKVDYTNTGRILSFIVTLDTEIKPEDAKKYASIITDGLKSKIKDYYDIQIIINTDKETESYPIAGYKNKTSEDFVWSGNSE